LKLGAEKIPVLFQHIQRHPLNGSILHVDLRKIDLNKKVETEVPVKFVGVSEAVSQKGGVLITQTEHLLIEALPQNIPQHIEIDILQSKKRQSIKVADISASKNIQ
jgi:large subunit ribosomal protein L25